MMSVIRLEPPGYHSVAPAGTALVVFALIATLAGAELLRACGSPSAESWRRRLQVATLPLLLCTIVVLVARLAPLAS
ncbi:MAG: hypothetical protein QOH72_4845 [Solirubrobacteraceae bacterium]|jgi:hypothetical protein|nr:hypothetical protein [Solirubrobacteraceae bacterium]